MVAKKRFLRLSKLCFAFQRPDCPTGITSSGWLSFSNGLTNVAALPGDTVFVPEELNKTTFSQEAKEWTQILYQFGLGAAALKTLKN